MCSSDLARARQMGLEAVQTDWVASTDADSLPAPHWLEVLNEAAPGRTALYGPMRFSGVPRHWALASGASYSAFLHVARLIGRPMFLLIALWLVLTRAVDPLATFWILIGGITIFNLCDAIASVGWFDVMSRSLSSRMRSRVMASGQIL